MPGPVHLIACHRGATESQSLKHLGFPDATAASTHSWVYVADKVQRIQIPFLANCRDETTTNLALSARAAARSRIVRAIARAEAVQPQVPAPALKKSKRIQISQIQSNKHHLPK